MARVLIIEDDELMRGALTKAIALAGHEVIEAANGQEGVLQFRQRGADVVITDIVMPVQEGVETILQLRKSSKTVPIIAMSGGVAHSKLYLKFAANFGARQVLSKPFTPQELLGAIEAALAETPPAASP